MLQSYIQTSVFTYETNYSRLQFTEIYFVMLCLRVMHVVRLGLLRYHLKVTRSITLLTCPIKFNRPELSLNESPQTEQLEDLQFFVIASLFHYRYSRYKQKRMPFIQQLLDMQDPLNWLQVGDTALNEFRTEGLASKLFPTLLPFEKEILVQVFNIIQLYHSVQQICHYSTYKCI